MMQKNSLFALLVLVLLMQSVLLVTAPHPTIGSSVLKSSSVPTPGAVVVGMGIAAAGVAAVAVNSSLASSSEGTEQHHDGNDTSPPPKKKRRHLLSSSPTASTKNEKGNTVQKAKEPSSIVDTWLKEGKRRKEKAKTRRALRRSIMTQEQKDKEAKAKRERPQEQKDKEAQAKRERSQEQKDKEAKDKKTKRAEEKQNKAQFCRGRIFDERRQLHTAWVLNDEKVPVAKYVYTGEDDKDDMKSMFVLHPNVPDEEDKTFIDKAVINRKMKFKRKNGNNKYYRVGPWTCDNIQDFVEDGSNTLGNNIPNDIPKDIKLVTRFSLGKMDKICRYCGGKGFKCEIQNSATIIQDGKEIKVVDFGDLCCKKGTVQGIKEYNLPPPLENLFTGNGPEEIYFRKNSRAFNNGMGMTSVVADKGWQTRCHNKKMDSMLTAGGQLFRRIGPLQQKEGRPPRGAQCMFYGAEEAASYRVLNAFKGQNKSTKKADMDKNIFKKLHQILISAKNKYIESFLGVREYVQKLEVKNMVRDIILALHANESTENLIHQGRLNAPQVKEVALLMPNDDGGGKKERFLTFNYMEPNDRVGLEFIPDYHRSYDPLQYPLLFPDGQDGWHPDLDHTLLQHINYMMMDREEITNPILCGNGVGQQFILDQYCKIELERLRWVELNQKTIRAELFSGFGDSIPKDVPLTADNLKRTGKKVVLPSTFIGGERYMHQQYLDSMALFQRFGRPHFFITKTANPKWKEITDALKDGQTAFDRPDLVGRVFKARKQKLLEELHSGYIFGKCVARTHCIEFQKRGLPHVHILIWLDMDKYIDPSVVDEIICAEIPQEYIDNVPDEKNPGTFKKVVNPLHTRVTTSMLHGPCGSHNPTRSCMCNGHCKWNYPKDYVTVTDLSDDGYPKYRRRDPDLDNTVSAAYTVHRNNKLYEYTSKDVIPYSKYLMQRFDCHINVEFCHSISAIKYLFGYIYKGCDQATVEVKTGPSTTIDNDWTGTTQVMNEVLEYQTKRYISSAEGCWRLRRNEVAERKPAVFRLNVHLPDQHTVYFNPDDCDFENFQHKLEESKNTPLTAYFDLVRKVNSTERKGDNETTEEKEEREKVNKLLFRQIPEHYTWDKKKKTWKKRQRVVSEDSMESPDQISRIYSVSPIETERYSLRLLLNHITGKESFEDLRTVHGELLPSFHAAAIAHNLVKNDEMWVKCMKEAAETQRNDTLLHKLFVTIILYCQVGDPRAFYETCASALSSNYTHRYKREFVKYPQLRHLVDGGAPLEDSKYIPDPSWTLDSFAKNSSLYLLNGLLSKHNCSLTQLYLPEPNLNQEQFLQVVLAERIFNPTDGTEFTKEKAAKYYRENVDKLNEDQKVVFNTMKELIQGNIPRDEHEGTFIFLDAPGGTGKTFTLNLLISWIIMEGKLVAATAASGIAATMLHNGRTAHNQLKFPINITEESMCNIKKQEELAQFLRDVSLIIIDEASMLDRFCYEALDRTLRDFTENEKTKFGGKAVLVSGDFRQLLEVLPGANRGKIVSRCLKKSTLWDDTVIHLKLRENMRVKNALATRPDDNEFKEKLSRYEEWLLKLGEGTLPSCCNNIIEIESEMCLETKDDVVNEVFDEFESNIGCAEYFQSRAIVTATNELVNEINDQLTHKMPGQLKTYHSIDNVGDDDNPTSFPTEFLNSLHLSGMADHSLHLKQDSVVILLRNIDIPAGHCNGTRYFVKKLGEFRLVLKKLYPEGNDNDILILPRIPMTSSAGTKLPFILTRLQFPIKVAYALTINRSQSQTFTGKCGILVPKSVWCHGQIYVMFSRSGNPDNIFVWANQDEFADLIQADKLQSGKKYLRNVVYTEVLS